MAIRWTQPPAQQALESGRRPTTNRQNRAPMTLSESAAVGNNVYAIPLAPGALKAIERPALQKLVLGHQGSRAELADQLGISQRSLNRKLKTLE